MRKKVVLAGMILGAALLAGCGAKQETTAGTTAGTTAAGGAAVSGGESTEEKTVYPAGTITIYGYGQPQYLQEYYDAWLERNRDIAPDVKIEIVQTEGAADSREKITMTVWPGPRMTCLTPSLSTRSI